MNKNDNQNTVCACGATFPVHPAGYCGGSGYAVKSNGERICYACADKAQVEELKDRSKPFIAYASGANIITWTGGKLMTVTRSNPCRLTRQSFTHDSKSYRSIHAVDIHGGHWTGRGSNGIAIRLRPVKG